jgi:coenzyme F420-reducing hydrogenase delta subunit
MHSWDDKGAIVVFCCNWAPYSAYLDLCQSGGRLPAPFYPVRVMCAGRIDPAMVLYALEKGAAGVLVLGCNDRECRYGPGPEQVRKTAEAVRGLMHVLGLEPQRFATATCSSQDREALSGEIEEIVNNTSRLWKSPFAD